MPSLAAIQESNRRLAGMRKSVGQPVKHEQTIVEHSVEPQIAQPAGVKAASFKAAYEARVKSGITPVNIEKPVTE